EADANTLKRTYVSKQAERMLGYPSKQWLSESDFWLKQMPVDDRERVMAQTLQSIAARKSFVCEYRLYKADREMIWVRDTVNILADGDRLILRASLWTFPKASKLSKS